MSLFDTIKCIYKKDRTLLPEEYETWLNITLNKWLTLNRKNVNVIKDIIEYMFYIEPKHYFYLLFFSVPQTFNIPYIKLPKKNVSVDDDLINQLKLVLGWSERELKLNRAILDKTVLSQKKHWKQEMGVT